MKAREHLAWLDSSAPRLELAIPELPREGTVLVRLLRIAAYGMSNFFEPALRAVRLGENQFNVLCYLVAAEGGAASPSDLSGLVGTSRANITRIVRELTAAGLVTTKAAERDGRRLLVRITAEGRKRTRASVPGFIGPVTSAFATLSPNERATLNRLLRKVIVAMDEAAHSYRAAA
jgi:MarR family transcriptional repressor of emrRAB